SGACGQQSSVWRQRCGNRDLYHRARSTRHSPPCTASPCGTPEGETSATRHMRSHIRLSFELLMRLDEPEPLVDPARYLCEEIGDVVGGVDRLAGRLGERCQRGGESFEVTAAARSSQQRPGCVQAAAPTHRTTFARLQHLFERREGTSALLHGHPRYLTKRAG